MPDGLMIPRWYEIALGEKGVHEIPGLDASPRIVSYLRSTTLAGDPASRMDETPWCSAFVNWCMEAAGVKGTGSALARSWLTWGVPSDRRLGAVVVLRSAHRSEMTTSGNHVGFYVSGDAGGVNVFGGNQGDEVKMSRFPLNKWDIVGVRWAS